MTKLDRVHSFPNEVTSDEELVEALGLKTPDFILEKGLELKAPQLLEVEFARINPLHILSFEKGMGKTIAYLLAAHNSGAKRWLIICGKSAMLTQWLHLQKYWPEKTISFVRGDEMDRTKAWNLAADVYIVTGPVFLRDMGRLKVRSGYSKRIAPSWADSPEFLVWDEWHKMLRNRKTAMQQLMKDMKLTRAIFSSGSAGGKGPHSQWVILNIIDRKFFSSYWKFVFTFCFVDDTPFGKKIVGVKNVAGWRNTVAPYIFHRKKDLKYYPPKTRQSLVVEMPKWEKKIHDDLKQNLLAIIEDEGLDLSVEEVVQNIRIITAPNVLAAAHKIRQLLICPKFIDPSLGWGAGLEAILDDTQTSELTHFVVSTPYTGPMPLIQRFFEENKIPAYIIKGGMEMEELKNVIDTWTRTGGVVIQSILFAESYELPAASNMYMLGYLHDPEQNSQAEDRIHRDIRVTPHPVNIYYIKHLDSYDEDIIEAMSLHADNVYALMSKPLPKGFLQ